jgi:YrbI family 3-deoxy-D-manno-octulosonate 8-phosphate phosphatase
MGIHLWHRAGYRFGVMTHRSSHVLKMRAAELGIEIVRQGTDDKLGTMEEILTQLGLTPNQVSYLGDDLPDLPAVRAAGLGVAVADAAAELREAADHVTSAAGGNGAVREIIEFILKAQRRWDDLIQPYLT